MANQQVLIIGDANSFLLHDIVQNIRQGSTLSISILNTNPNQTIIDPAIYSKALYPNKIQLQLQKISAKISPSLAFFLMRFFIKQCLKNSKAYYDTIHIHFFNKNFLYIDIEHIKNATNKLIITFWGSDFYKRTNSQKERMAPYLNYASNIIFSNPNMMEDFTNYFNAYQSKCSTLATGLGILSTIDKLMKRDEAKHSCKQELGIDPQTTVISIGYSSHPDQHQVEITQALANSLSACQLQKIHFVFPLTYGDEDYKQQIIETAEKNNLLYTAFTQRMGMEQIAKIRIASDVMIHLRDTDQFSGSFQEYLYTHNIVITGNWLPYKFIIKKGIYMHTINSMNELPNILTHILNNFNTELEKTTNNKKIIADISHWNILVDKHISLYTKTTPA